MKLIIDTETISMELTKKLLELDNSLVGTKDYMGYTYFWSCEYKHALRDASYAQRQKVHNALLDAGLDVSAESKAHADIIRKCLKIDWKFNTEEESPKPLKVGEKIIILWNGKEL